MKKVILCVDDEPIILTAVKYQLQRDFENIATVETAGSGEEAIGIIEDLNSSDAELAVVISDQIMPGMKGDEFLVRAQGISPNSIKILLTGQASMEVILKSLNKANLYRFIAKPWDQLDMELTIREAINIFDKDIVLKRQNDSLNELNETLEKKVNERTREFDEKNRELQLSMTEVVATQRKLIESEKMAALGQLIAGVAHEVNTPLSIITAAIGQNVYLSQTLLEDLSGILVLFNESEHVLFRHLLGEFKNVFFTSREERERKKNLVEFFVAHNISLDIVAAEQFVEIGITDGLEKYLPLLMNPRAGQIVRVVNGLLMMQKNRGHIQEAIKKATKIIYALKSYSRITTSENPSPINLIENIETVLVLYQNFLKHGIDLIRNYPESEISIMGFPDELNQIWTNLIHNSIQAMENKGTLTIHITRQNKNAEVRISDTGPGIPAAIQNRIFEPFFTTKRTGEGSGLGLDIAKIIVEKHRGTIRFETEEGRGTSFVVTLPSP